MRPIKFRAWSYDEKRMLLGSELLERWVMGADRENAHELEIHDGAPHIVIMQFTGLQDKNGVNIYEGDMFRNLGNRSNQSAIKEIKWTLTTGHNGFNVSPKGAANGVVIGNIYENPELLKRIDGSGAGDESTASEQREIEGNDTANPGLRSEQ